MVEENQKLKQVNNDLIDRVSKLETHQQGNNAIITGIPEQPRESFESTQQRIHDILAVAIQDKFPDKDSAIEAAIKFQISYCSRVGHQRMGYDRPISVTFHKKGDKDKLMNSKSKLLKGIHVNNEFSPQIKQNRDRLRPILKLAKSSSQYKDKSRLEGDVLIINGQRYTVNINTLPKDLAAYKAMQKEDTETIAFHSKWSSCSNLHYSPFTLNGQKYQLAEQWIQSQKALYFGDSYTANLILRADTPYECKRLGYQINGYDHTQWRNEGYDLCKDRIKEKFTQNQALLKCLKAQLQKY